MTVRRIPNESYFQGLVVPLVLLGFVLEQAVRGRIVLPRRRYSEWIVYSQTSIVVGAVLLELAVAVGLFAWYILAYDDDYESWVTPILLTSVSIVLLGSGLLIWGLAG